VLTFGFGDWHGVAFVPIATEDSAADRVASLAPVPVVAFAPVGAGLSLGSTVSGVVAEPPLAGEVLLVGVGGGVGLTGGDVEGGGVVLGVVDPVVGLVGWNGGAVEACPELYGVGLGLHAGALLGELDAEGYGDREP
jgi:hypothetical protein